MPIKGMPSNVDHVNISHQCKIYHISGYPLACIVEENMLNKQRYDSFSDNPTLEARVIPKVVETKDHGWSMIIELSVRSSTDQMDFTIFPDDEFIEVLINNAEINFTDPTPKPIFSMGLKDINKILELKQKLYELRQNVDKN